jgi:hypothetical protein
MRSSQYTISIILFLVLCQLSIPSFSQLGISFDIKKPKQYDERVLRSEKTGQKKFTLTRRLIQNTTTHYNYYFNANNRLNDVIERAKSSFTDDYENLLPFYNYTLEATLKDSIQLDSISYKSQTGLALHDLRSDWADNLYLLWGASYYLRKEFDSAYLMFQFINYAFAEKEKDGYYRSIGSSRDGNTAFSIATREKTSLAKKIFSEPPSRNDAFIWQIRNFLAQDQFTEAASLIVTLKNDPVFPKRLQNDLQEVQAYWFYKQNMWDSSVTHLVNALDNATNKQEKARWEYLAAQLYEMTGHYQESEKYYAKVIGHTTDPVMAVYARLFSIRVNKDSSHNYIEKNITELVKMARRDRYEDYRDIIYYMAAQMELERGNVDGALALLQKSTQYSTTNIAQRNKAFLQLAELSFNKRRYRQAYNFYDSLRLDDPSLKDPNALNKRKELLGRIAANIEIIETQDSLQHIAAMPENERRDFVKKLVKQLRRQEGLKDEGTVTTSPFGPQTAPILFSPADPKGDWYFYNASSRTRGAGDFKVQWGNRPNRDNWRRSSAINGALQAKTDINTDNLQTTGEGRDNTNSEITFDGLYDKLPLTPKMIKKSDDSIQSALFALGKIYIQEIEDCSIGTETYESLRTRFPEFEKMDEVLFNLYYCYNKNGETAKANDIKKLMSEKHPGSNFTTIVTTGKNPQSTSANPEATKEYEKVYDLFIEGNFEQAVAQKKIADSLYGHNYWTPQLLYIEAVYYIKQRDDSTAKIVLKNIVNRFTGTALADKATTLLDVLSRRKKIEDELRNMNITRYPDDTVINRTTNPVVITRPVQRNDSAGLVKISQPVVTNNNKPVTDTSSSKPVPVNVNAAYTFSANAEHYVVLVLTKVAPVFCNEAKNAFAIYNREAYSNKFFRTDLIELDADNRLLLISPFKTAQEALDYVTQARPKTASEIIPWLKGGKYYFTIIDDKNLDLLKAKKDPDNYQNFLNQNLPGKFPPQ